MTELKHTFPILDEMIYSGETPVDHGMKLFSIQEIADIYYADPNATNLHEDFGPIRLPYSHAWFEFTDRSRIRSAEESEAIGWFSEVNYAVEMAEYPIPGESVPELIVALTRKGGSQFGKSGLWLGDAVSCIKARGFIKPPTNTPTTAMNTMRTIIQKIEAFLYVDKDGKPIDVYYAIDAPGMPSDAQRYLKESFGSFLHAAWMAIGIANCKNITTSTATTRPTTSKKDRKKRRPETTYQVINLPTPTRRSGTNAKPGEDTQGKSATRLHTVRGHFKTYTKEKPLMGMHVGTYWWSWTARGNADNGEIISTYNVKEA